MYFRVVARIMVSDAPNLERLTSCPGMFGKNAQPSGNGTQLFDSGYIADDSLFDRLDIIEMPVSATTPV
ncbi:MAG: hypothetical protein OXN84_19075 [Albidovulum sp.]|nr:hypothetical protein [Albidovulum sp.]